MLKVRGADEHDTNCTVLKAQLFGNKPARSVSASKLPDLTQRKMFLRVNIIMQFFGDYFSV